MLVATKGLSRTYGDILVLDNVNLEISESGIVGILGQNGAGKSTLVEILEGLRTRSGGEVRVLGLDPQRDGQQLRERLGIQLQATQLPETLTPTETLRMLGGFFETAQKPGPLLEMVGLSAKAHKLNRTLSGGQRQRLSLAMALINDPDLIMLDEPTVGLDPVSRRELHGLLRDLRDRKRLILMTTHYLEEAESLCDRVIVLDKGRIIADAAPSDLGRTRALQTSIELQAHEGFDDAPLLAAGLHKTHIDGQRRHYATADTPSALRAVATLVESGTASLQDLRIHAPSLEQSYLDLVSGPAEERDARQ